MSRLSAFLAGRMQPRSAVALAWGVAGALFLAKSTSVFGVRDLDTDDVMRLVQVRDLLAGQGWFDLTQHRVDPPDGLVMHWSRLVDAPIAGLIALLRLPLPADAAERVAAALWPTLLLLPALAAVASIARSLAGRAAIPVALMLFCVVGPAGTQFFAGRIDHHNVQILACLTAVAAVLRLPAARWAGLAAGLAGAVMLAVGVETLPYLIVLCGAAALMGAHDPDRAAPGAVLFGLGLAGGAALLTAATVPPQQVLAAHCDAISAPYLGAAVAGGLALAAGALLMRRTPSGAARLALAVAPGAVALAAVAVFGPHCLLGPVAEIDPRLGPVWLEGVQEMEPLLRLLRSADMLAASTVVAAAFGAASWAVLAQGPPTRAAGPTLCLVLIGVALLVAAGQIRGAYYVNAFASPLIAAGLATAVRRLQVTPDRVGTAALAGVLAVSAPGMLLNMAFGTGPGAPSGVASASAAPAPVAALPHGPGQTSLSAPGCAEPNVYAPIGALPPGLVLAGVDLGPLILAGTTAHTVLGAPYHRNAAGILASHDLLAGSVDGAEERLRGRGVRYVALCGRTPEQDGAGSLAAALAAGAPPAWLELAVRNGPLRVYRLRSVGAG
ncbi:hypothetical protein [Alsobacter sp. SYSU BS001988]